MGSEELPPGAAFVPPLPFQFILAMVTHATNERIALELDYLEAWCAAYVNGATVRLESRG